jgi:hypothetical protein
MKRVSGFDDGEPRKKEKPDAKICLGGAGEAWAQEPESDESRPFPPGRERKALSRELIYQEHRLSGTALTIL